MRRLALVAWLAATAAACTLDPFALGGGAGAGDDDDDGGGPAADAAPPSDAAPPEDGGPPPDACVPLAEVCNGRDDDCDDLVDEGFDLAGDVDNCGVCGTRCGFTNAQAACVAGECVQGACLNGFFDTDATQEGCDYQCSRSNGGVEACDGADNDCDRAIDEGFDLQADVNNCGACNRVCALSNATAACAQGQCVLATDGGGEPVCAAGFRDRDGEDANGCECKLSNGGVEACDGIDNDCDDQIDEDFPDKGTVCGNGLLGVCARSGTFVCAAGGAATVCTAPAVRGGREACDGLDNDCDGAIDEDFDLDVDARNCGQCGRSCSFPNAVAACQGGGCVISSCAFGFVDLDPDVAGCEYACTKVSDGEACNGRDDDCDGAIDEGFDTATDPLNCGGCGAACDLDGVAENGCAGGACTVVSCDFGRHDLAGGAADGCEYRCVASGDEECDDVDNDCDGVADDGFDKDTDVANCGFCGAVCAFANADAACVDGGCQPGACAGGFVDVNGDPDDGCECQITNDGVEACDNEDNDCDGAIDEAFATKGDACAAGVGGCARTGSLRCTTDELGVECSAVAGTPSAELCNGADDDCDGTVDDGFDTTTDPRNCGGCGNVCSVANAVAACAGGACAIGTCLNGFHDVRNGATDGCEYACDETGVEVCDGLDNDCDDRLDAADDDLVLPAENPCDHDGECALGTDGLASHLACLGGELLCNYRGTVQQDPPVSAFVAQFVTIFDGLDNNCHEVSDDVAEVGGACDDGAIGACRSTGTTACAATTGCDVAVRTDCLACAIEQEGAAAADEQCNGVDDDCDGLVDEPWASSAGGTSFAGVRPDVQAITRGATTFRIFTFEASRPDADGGQDGVVEGLACSVGARLPRANATFGDAEAACAAAGMRLCDAGEWQAACEGPAPERLFPYGDAYDPGACNGNDLDADLSTAPDDDFALPTGDGRLAGCVSAEGVHDLSGNLKEWTDDLSVSGESAGVRGGAFDNPESGLTCAFDFISAPVAFSFDNLGFRCCSSCDPGAGLADCGGLCVDLGSDDANCGGCGVGCAPGESCDNGACR